MHQLFTGPTSFCCETPHPRRLSYDSMFVVNQLLVAKYVDMIK